MSTSRARSKSALSTTNSSHLGKKDYAIGISLLLVVVFLWTTSNFVTQDLFQDGYEKAFLVTYLNTSAFALYLLPSLVGYFLKKYSVSWRSRSTEYEPLQIEDDTDLDNPPTHGPGSPDNHELPPLTVRETANLAFVFLLHLVRCKLDTECIIRLH